MTGDKGATSILPLPLPPSKICPSNTTQNNVLPVLFCPREDAATVWKYVLAAWCVDSNTYQFLPLHFAIIRQAVLTPLLLLLTFVSQ